MSSGPDTSPVEAGLGFTCKLGTAIPFRGREAVEKHKAQGVSRRLVSLVVSDPAAYAWGGELSRTATRPRLPRRAPRL